VSWFEIANDSIRDIHQDNGELTDIVNRIHNPVPASCENVITVKADSSIDTRPAEELDDLGNLVEALTTPVEIKEIIEETGIPEDEDFDDEDWDDGDWEETPEVTTSDTVYTTSSTESTVETSDTFYTTSSTSETSSTIDEDGQSCPVNGQQKCAHVGKTGSWLTCNFEKWLVRDCAPGLVCKESQGNMNQVA
jgi:hypothetical protein